MTVTARQRRKYRGLARARLKLGIDALNRLLNYNEKHPDMGLFDGADIIIVNQVITTLSNAMLETVGV